jgi:hypothetical protein
VAPVNGNDKDSPTVAGNFMPMKQDLQLKTPIPSDKTDNSINVS